MKIKIADSDRPRLRLLFLVPDLNGIEPLDPRGELARMEQVASEGDILVDALTGRVTREEFSDALLVGNYDVVHIGTHGFRAGIELSGEILRANELGRMLRVHCLSACVLLACNSARYCATLGLPAVGVDGEVSNELAWRFAREFYSYLVRRFDLIAAFDYALSRLPEKEADMFVLVPEPTVPRSALDMEGLRADMNAGFREMAGLLKQTETNLMRQQRALAKAMLQLVEVFRG